MADGRQACSGRVGALACACAIGLALAFPDAVALGARQRTASAELAEVQRRAEAYVALRAALERELEPLRPVRSAVELSARQNALAEAVRRARTAAPAERLVPPAAAAHIRAILRDYYLAQPAADSPPDAVDLLPSGHPPLINGRYPTYEPLSTIPPQLVARLPRLPDNLQFRFHGDYLLVLDADLLLVLDIVPDALPPYGSDTAAVRRAAGTRAAEGGSGLLFTGGDSIQFAVIGDSGTGGRAQQLIANEMAAARERFPYAFVMMLGDNLYGDEDPDDYVEKFEEPYAALLKAGVVFHAALGNHDEPAQRFYGPFNMGGRRYYTVRKGPVEFFVLDSTYMREAQLAWLAGALAASDAPWKVATMHHPIYSTGRRHGASEELREVLEPVLVRGGVDLVLTGHEHFYERIRPQHGIHYLTSGSAAKLRQRGVRGGPETVASYDEGYSFLLVAMDRDRLAFEAVSARGEVVDAGVLRRGQLPTAR